MNEFFQALADPNVDFIRNALIAGLISSISFGIVGSYVVARRISYIAAAIAHSILGGIGAALFLRYRVGWEWCSPLGGAVVAALVSAVVIGLVSLRKEEREDTVIGAIWATGMAVGLICIHFTPNIPGKNLESYIFGNILYTSRSDLYLTAVLATIVVVVSLLFYNKLLAVCFDEEFARLRGVNVPFYFLLLLCLIGLSVVLLVRLTGIILAIALIVLPAATASHFSKRLSVVMVIAVGLSMIFTAGGLAFSFPTQTPTGPVIVITAAATYVLSLLAPKLRNGTKAK